MNNYEFCEWLEEELHFKKRSARDVVSRLRRVDNIIGLPNIITSEVIDKLTNSEQFNNLSTTIKCQLKRALVLFGKFQNNRDNVNSKFNSDISEIKDI